MAAAPVHRLVLLGASNLARGADTALETARLYLGRPLDVLAAFGHGRSYGNRDGLLWHQQPGIVECGLWPALAARPALPTSALVTDVGNDLLWDVPVPQIVAWVTACVDRLLQAGARVVLTPLPLCTISHLPRWKFQLFRAVTFPGSRLTHAQALERSRQLDDELRALSAARGLRLVEPLPEWYGFDPIHVRRGCYAKAWHEVLSSWRRPEEAEPPLARGSLRLGLHIKRLAPEVRWLLGREQRHAQPAGRLADGTTLSFY